MNFPMKNVLPLSLLALLSFPAIAADTTFECEASTGEYALIEYDNGALSMTVKGTGNVDHLHADRHVFPSLAPFRENEDGVLVSLTHVADMTSYNDQTDLFPGPAVRQDMFHFVSLRVSPVDETTSKVSWNIDSFGVSKSFEILCDKTSQWETEHRVVL